MNRIQSKDTLRSKQKRGIRGFFIAQADAIRRRVDKRGEKMNSAALIRAIRNGR